MTSAFRKPKSFFKSIYAVLKDSRKKETSFIVYKTTAQIS